MKAKKKQNTQYGSLSKPRKTMKTFLEWLKLNEMPLTHYGHNFINNDEDDPPEVLTKDKSQDYKNTPERWMPGAEKFQGLTITDKFSKRDKRIISHPKTAKILEQKLKSSNYNFNILFIEKYKYDVSFIDKKQDRKNDPLKSLSQRFKEYVEENNINIDNSITYVSTNSTGHMMTPWMILHKMAHALVRHNPNSYETFQQFYEVIKTIDRSDYSNIFSFKSAQETGKNSITEDIMELFHELIAEYLWNNKIRLNPQASKNKIQTYQNAIRQIEPLIIGTLDKSVGKVINDI